MGLRILADHGRAMSMLVADGVLPSNEGRGYVLRRIIRRAVRRARQLGVDEPVTPRLVAPRWPSWARPTRRLAEQHRLVADVVDREEEGFLRTLATGSAILEEELASGADVASPARWPSASTTPTGSRSSSPWRSPRRPGSASTSRASRRPWTDQRTPGPRGGRGPDKRWPARRPTGRCSTPRARPSSWASGPTATRRPPGWWRCWPTGPGPRR